MLARTRPRVHNTRSLSCRGKPGRDGTLLIESIPLRDFTQWKEHDAYQRAFARLLRDLTTEDTTNPS